MQEAKSMVLWVVAKGLGEGVVRVREEQARFLPLQEKDRAAFILHLISLLYSCLPKFYINTATTAVLCSHSPGFPSHSGESQRSSTGCAPTAHPLTMS